MPCTRHHASSVAETSWHGKKKVSEAFPQDPLPPKHPSLLESEVGGDGAGGSDASEPEGERAAEAEVVNLDFAEVASATSAGEEEDQPHYGTSGVKGEGTPEDSVVGKVVDVDVEDAERKGDASAREEIASDQMEIASEEGYCANEGDGTGPGGDDQESKNSDDEETRAIVFEENGNGGGDEAAAPVGDSQGESDATSSDGDPQSNHQEEQVCQKDPTRRRLKNVFA